MADENTNTKGLRHKPTKPERFAKRFLTTKKFTLVLLGVFLAVALVPLIFLQAQAKLFAVAKVGWVKINDAFSPNPYGETFITGPSPTVHTWRGYAIELYANDSTGPGGDSLEGTWSCSGGLLSFAGPWSLPHAFSPGSISAYGGASWSIGGLTRPTTYTCSLSVHDVTSGLDSTNPATITIVVDAPVAKASANQNVVSGDTVQIHGNHSTYPNGTQVAVVQWTQTAGPLVTLTQVPATSLGQVTFTAPTVATPTPLVFSLQVNDNFSIETTPTHSPQPLSDPDTVTITVNPPVIDGSCSANHYSCTAGRSANNVNGASAWTWDCNGSGGGRDTSCSETKIVSLPSCDGVGLRMFDATAGKNIIINTEQGLPTSPLRIQRGGVTYGIPLVDLRGLNASPIHIKTSSGIKALQMCP